MTHVKICGIRTQETLQLLVELQVDYVGFVFAPSKRQISGLEAGRLLAAVENHPVPVGVFVNPTVEELDEVLSYANLDVIQLHGQESPAFCAEVKERFGKKVWKAISVGKPGFSASSLAQYRLSVDGFLFDTYSADMAGGTGKRFDWAAIPQLMEETAGQASVFAGGIDGQNVGELLASFAPQAIDVSSGVETDGVKDEQKLREFMKRVRENVPNHIS
ncbi:UNVERIFIED_CONTAM: phosphoribosylanthranilate isomerase [Brevibacillus sp. OAP136]